MSLLIKMRSTRTAGFTLVELLVALVLLSLVFLLLTSGLRLGAKVWNVGDEAVPNRSEVLAAHHLLRRVLSEARPIMIEARPRHVFFTGDDDSIRLVTSVPGHLGLGGLYEVAIYMAKDPNRVEMSWRLFRRTNALVGPALKEQHSMLMSRVAALRFAYFGNRGTGYLRGREPPRWYNDWHDLQYLPDLIRMHVEFVQGENRWPDLVVKPMVESLDLTIEPESAR
jgi:general secretion pathway protein J